MAIFFLQVGKVNYSPYYKSNEDVTIKRTSIGSGQVPVFLLSYKSLVKNCHCIVPEGTPESFNPYHCPTCMNFASERIIHVWNSLSHSTKFSYISVSC